MRLLLPKPGTMHVLGAAARIGDLPGAAQQLHRFSAVVLDLHAIRPDEMVLVRLRFVREIERTDRHADAARCFRVTVLLVARIAASGGSTTARFDPRLRGCASVAAIGLGIIIWHGRIDPFAWKA